MKLILVNGRPMVKMIVDNIKISGHYNFIPKQSDYEQYNLQYLFRLIAPACKIIVAEKDTASQIHTVLLANSSIDNDQPLLIVNCQQFIEWDADDFYKFCIDTKHDGVIATFSNTHPRFSYVVVDSQGLVKQAAEKKNISNVATCGVYFWRRGSDFCKYAKSAIAGNSAEDCSVITAYMEAIKEGLVFDTYKCENSWQLKFPKDLESFYRSGKLTQMNVAA